MWMLWSSSSPVGHHPDGRANLATKYHVVVLACMRGGIILTLDICSPPTTTRVEVHFLNLLHQQDIPHCVPGIKPTPDDWFDVVKSGDSTDAAEDDHLEYQQLLQVPVLLNDSDPEVGQHCEETVSPPAVGEVVQWQGTSSDTVVRPLPLCILGSTNPTIEVGSIIEMDGVAKYPDEPPIRDSEPLQSRVCLFELLLHEGTGQGLPMHALHVAVSRGCVSQHSCIGHGIGCVTQRSVISNGPSNHPTRVSRRTTGVIQVGIGNDQGHCRNDGGRDKYPGMAIAAGTTGAAVCANSCARSGCQGRHCRYRSFNNACDGEGPGACWATSSVIPPTGKEPRARWAMPLVLPPTGKMPMVS